MPDPEERHSSTCIEAKGCETATAAASVPPTVPGVSAAQSRSLTTRVAVAIETGSLAELASTTGLDPCHVVAEATPALTLGDLLPGDAAWVRAHTGSCSDCSAEIRASNALDAILGRLGDSRVPADPVSVSVATVQRPVRKASAWSRSSSWRRARVWSIDTPVGGLFLAASNAGICEVDFAATMDEARLISRLESRGFAPELTPASAGRGELGRIGEAFAGYLSGGHESVDVPIDLAGVTEFTRAVLDATSRIPFGAVATYGAIAAQIGQPSASRAVGNALGRNPVPLVIPCHRIVRSDLSTGGFVGGAAIKEQLLRLERTGAQSRI